MKMIVELQNQIHFAQADFAEFRSLEKELHNLWEGCIPWTEAIAMIAAPEHQLNALWKSWQSWDKRFLDGLRSEEGPE
jgi:hypothetical protein